MLRALAERGDERSHLIFTGHSTWDRVPVREELARLEGEMKLKVIHVLEEPPDDWNGEEGWITREMLDRHLPPERSEYHYFICGPVPMIRAMEAFLHDLGIHRAKVHTELFDMV
jgi:ferredoxin-NADP reductase